MAFSLIAARLIDVVIFHGGGVYTEIPNTNVFYTVTIILIFAVFPAAFIYRLLRSSVVLARILIWIARGNHEKRIGSIGLIFLLVGFVLQAWVNILPTPHG